MQYLSYLCGLLHIHTMKQIRKIIHVEFRTPIGGKAHYYFGSKAAIYQRFGVEQIGITYKTLMNIGSIKEKPYENVKCIIREGDLITSARKNTEEE